jgi:hypothetical protein
MGNEKGADYHHPCLPSLEDDLPLQALDVLAAHFVIEHMCYLISRNLLSGGTFVDTVVLERIRTCERQNEEAKDAPHHSYSYRPGSVSDGKAKIGIVGALVLAFLHVVHDFGHPCQHIIGEILDGASRISSAEMIRKHK